MNHGGAQLPDEPQRLRNLRRVRPPPGAGRGSRERRLDHFGAGCGAGRAEGIGVAPHHRAKPGPGQPTRQIEEYALAAPDPVVALMNKENRLWSRASLQSADQRRRGLAVAGTARLGKRS